jgi:hypothetical protein
MPLTNPKGSVASDLPASGVTLTGTQTLTNKTLTTPTITGAAVSLAANPTNALDAAPKQYVDALTGALPLQTGNAGKFVTTNGTTASWTYNEIPQNSQSAAYTLVATDSGKHIYHPSADTTARTFTIPANASVAYPIGTALTFVNDTSAGVVTIAINTDTMVLAGAGTTGSRTLAANGIATAIKTTATRWMISGTGLT